MWSSTKAKGTRKSMEGQSYGICIYAVVGMVVSGTGRGELNILPVPILQMQIIFFF